MYIYIYLKTIILFNTSSSLALLYKITIIALYVSAPTQTYAVSIIISLYRRKPKIKEAKFLPKVTQLSK